MNDELNPYAPPPDSDSLQAIPEVWLSEHVWRDGRLLVIGRGAELRPRCFVTGADTNSSVVVRSYWQPRWVYLLLLLYIVPYFILAPFFRHYLQLKVPIDANLLAQRRRQSTRAGYMAAYGFVGFCLLLQWESAGVWLFPLLCTCSMVFFIGIAFARAPLVGLQIERLDDEILVLRNLPRRCLEGLPEWGLAKPLRLPHQ